MTNRWIDGPDPFEEWKFKMLGLFDEWLVEIAAEEEIRCAIALGDKDSIALIRAAAKDKINQLLR
jgi:hypothetical protein